MNRLDEWVHFIAKQLKSDTELVGAQAKHELYEDAARATFIRTALEPFLPGNFGIGSGRVIDSSGNSSCEQDIIIYHRDFPQLNLADNARVFLYESVLATFAVKTKMIRKTFNEALDQCASMATLKPVINPTILQSLAIKNELSMNQNGEYVHGDALRTERFGLLGRPLSFVYAFSGYQTKPAQLAENISLWIEQRHAQELDTPMKSLPAVIATQGCFAWRNAAPFAIKNNIQLGTGNDDAPIRLIFLQLLYALNRRLRVSTDSHGLKLNLDEYLKQIDPPEITGAVGRPSHSSLQPAAEKVVSRPATATKVEAATQPTAARVSTLETTAQPVEPAKPLDKPETTTATSIRKETETEKTAYSEAVFTSSRSKFEPGSDLDSMLQTSQFPVPELNADTDSGESDFSETVQVSASKKAQDEDPFLQTMVMAPDDPNFSTPVRKSEIDAEIDPFTRTIPQ